MHTHLGSRIGAVVLVAVAAIANVEYVSAAMTMKQLTQSMEMFRTKCMQKTSVELDLVEGLHKGQFPETSKELKCYTMCVAQMAGTLNRKNDLVEAKVKQQIEVLLPVNLRELALRTLEACKEIRHQYKDPCDKTFYMTQCMYQYSPKDFLYP